MHLVRQYILEQYLGDDTWYLWSKDREYVIHRDQDPMALMERVFVAPDQRRGGRGSGNHE